VSRFLLFFSASISPAFFFFFLQLFAHEEPISSLSPIFFPPFFPFFFLPGTRIRGSGSPPSLPIGVWKKIDVRVLFPPLSG